MNREGEFEEMVLHGGDMIVHTWVEEGEHDLLFSEGDPVELAVWLPPGDVVLDCFGSLVALDLFG